MSQEEPRHYNLRLQPRAERDIADLIRRQEELAGEASARAWYRGLFEEIAKLSENPRRCAFVPESRHFRQEVRHLVFRRTPDGPAWRIVFAITDEDPSALDPPTVNIIHVRHGSHRPISRREAKGFEDDD